MKVKPKTIGKAKSSRASIRERGNDRVLYLASLMDNMSDALIATDMDFNILEWNPAAENLYGWTAAEVSGHPLQEFIQSEYMDATTRKDAIKAVQEQGVWKGEVTQKRKNGTQFPLMASVSVVKDESGKSIGFVAINRDITGRKQAEEKLNLSEVRYRRLFESAKDGILILDAETGLIVDVNPFLITLLGYSKEAFLGKSLWELGFFKDIAANKAHFLELQQKEYIRYEDLPLETVQGRKINVEFVSNIYEVDHQKVIQCNIRDITERKRAEEEHHKSEKKFSTAFHKSPAAMTITRLADGTFIDANEEFLNTFEFTRDEVIGHTSIELNMLGPEARRLLIERQLATGGLQDTELEAQSKSGRTITILFSSSPIDINHEAHHLTTMIDVTERKQAEARLNQSEMRYRRLFESAKDGILILDAETGMIVDINPFLITLLGYSKEAFLGKSIWELGFFKDIIANKANFLELQQKEYIRYEDLPLETAHGGRINVEFVSNVYEVDHQKVIQCNIRDITERKRAEEKIQRQLEHLNSLRVIDTTISSSFDLHATLDIVLQQVLSQLGVDAAAILLVNSDEQTIEYAASLGFDSNVLHYTQLKLNEGYAGRAVRERRTIHVPNLLKAGGKLAEAMQSAKEDFVDYYGTPLIVKGEVKGVLEVYHRSLLSADAEWLEFLEALAAQAAIAIDNAQLFEGLQRANAELEQRVAQRTAELNKTNIELERANHTKDEFLANMSHELRTPLNSILGLSETLLEQQRDPLSDYQQRSLQIIASGGEHLLELINDILDLSKIEAGKFDYYPQVIGVEDLCRGSLAFVKEAATEKSITVTYMPEMAIHKIYADPRRLKQILVNLLTNAVKFTPDQGYVTLQVQADVEQDRIQFSVIDTGIGIAPADLKKLFQPFQQVDSSRTREYEGTGLGLSLVQKLTDLHGGSVEVESEVGKGSRFTVNLSIGQAILDQQVILDAGDEVVIKQTTAAFNKPVEPPVEHGTILLAEDNMSNVLTVGDYLENHGYQVVVAHDGLEAIRKAQEIHPNIILMDIQMPAMDGLEAMRRLRADKRFNTTPIIALTALAMPGDRERCLEAGANEYISKPASLKSLVKTIDNLLKL